jgi:hypothetical protein
LLFTDFTKSQSGLIITLKNYNALTNVEDIKFYQETVTGLFAKKEFRWAFTPEHWSSWETLTPNNFNNTKINGKPSLFFEIRYILSSANSGKVTSFLVNYSIVTGAVDPAAQTTIPVPAKVKPIDPKAEPDQEKPIEKAPVSNAAPQEPATEIPNNLPKYEPTPPLEELTDEEFISKYNPAEEPIRKTVVTSVTNADTLDYKTSEYYLWRPYHKGTQEIKTIKGLQAVLNNLTNGIQSSIFSATSVDTRGVEVLYDQAAHNLVFKRIEGVGGVVITEENGLITFDIDDILAVRDPSTDEIYAWFARLEGELDDVSIYIDNKFLEVDASIIRIDDNITLINTYQSIQDASISNLDAYNLIQDNSILRKWNIDGITNVTDPSIIGDVNFVGNIEISDGSLNLGGNLIFDTSGLIANVENIDFWNSNGDPGHLEGRLYYDSTEKALTYMNDAVDMKVQIAQEQIVRSRNSTGSTILNGTPVKVVGSQGQRPKIDLASSHIHTDISQDSEILGISTHDILNNVDGFITTFGLVGGLNTSSYTEGDVIYVSSTPGLLTNIKPDPPYDVIKIGVVINSHANQGKIFVNILPPIHFHDLSGVSDSSVYNNSVWLFNADNSIWEPSTGLVLNIDNINLDIFRIDTYNSIQDASISNLDASIRRLDAYNLIQDSSIFNLDSSINRLDSYNLIQDASIALTDPNQIASLDASIIRIDAYQTIQDTSINVALNTAVSGLDASTDYATYSPLIGDVSIYRTGDNVSQILTINSEGTKTVDFSYTGDNVTQIDISTYGLVSRVITFDRDGDDNVIGIHIN